MAARTHLLIIAGLILLTPMVYAAPGNEGDLSGGNPAQAGEPSLKGTFEKRLHPGHGAEKSEMLAKVLNLTEDQKKQLKAVHDKQKENMKAVFEQMKSNREALDAEIIKPAPDMNKIDELQNQLKKMQSEMIDNRLNSKLEIKKLLNHEQFAGFMALEKERKLGMRFKHERGHFKVRGFGHGQHDGPHTDGMGPQ